MWWLYELLLLAGFLLYLPRAVSRRRLPHRGWSMRVGRYPRELLDALRGRRSLWIHAVSVGEVSAVRPLLDVLIRRHPEEAVALSTLTPGGFTMASQAVEGRGAALYVPLDLRVCVNRALDVLRPRLLLLVESELWPVLILRAHERGVPVAVINGRISERAFRRYQAVKPWLSGTLHRVELFLMQGEGDAERLRQMGASPERIRVVGSLKWDASVGARPTAETLQQTAARIGLGRETVVVAGSTHRGEETAILQAFYALRASDRDARLLIAPRHLERVEEVEQLGHRAGFKVARLSQAGPAQAWDVGVVDTFGELSKLYGLATVVIIGGSFIPHGGQNPLEAASLGKPILFGPSMHNFAEIAPPLVAHQAARQLGHSRELVHALQELIANRAKAEQMGQRALQLTERSRGALTRTLEALTPLLAP